MKDKVSMQVTPTENTLSLRLADFNNLSEALDYAAKGVTGCNFYRRGKLSFVLPYEKLREDSISIARRLSGLGLKRGSRVALIADTDPDFLRFFFACQYAGLVPVPMPAFVNMGGHKAYVSQLNRLVSICGASVAIAPKAFSSFLVEAVKTLDLSFTGTPSDFLKLPESKEDLKPLDGVEPAYIQYTSGSTRFPRGAVISQASVISNLAEIGAYGLKIGRTDRSVSWLPFYHDMGLVGFVLGPVAFQRSVDYLSTYDFAVRPRQWLTIISENHATISIGPPFGYELSARCIKEDDITSLDLSSWRCAGIGAEMIRAEQMEDFAKIFAPCGFKKTAFVACYGMAECSLAVSFSALNRGLELDCVDADELALKNRAVPCDSTQKASDHNIKTFVKCGKPLPQYEIEVRDSRGAVLPERHCGLLFLRGPSIMSEYFGDPETTAEVLSPDGWLNTGDLAYITSDGDIVITGRKKDLIIIKGRNIWPQDLECLAQLQPEVRSGGVAAFSVPGPDGSEMAAMMVECRQPDKEKRHEIKERLKRMVFEEFGIDCVICLVSRNVLPRTTSGKLSRSEARKRFLDRVGTTYLTKTDVDLYKQAI